jgi:hypothetical protein
MTRSWKVTLVASLVGTVAGTSVSLFNLGEYIWRGHASLAAFLITLGTSIGVLVFWPKESENEPQRS